MTCTCGPDDVDHESGTGPTHNGAITVTGWCVHGNAVAETYDSIL